MICADAQGLDATVDDLGLVWALSLHNRDSMAEVFQLAKIFEDLHIKKSIIHQCVRDQFKLRSIVTGVTDGHLDGSIGTASLFVNGDSEFRRFIGQQDAQSVKDAL